MKVLAILLLTMTAAQAETVTCERSPGRGQYYTWREIDGQRCWYPGHKVLPKSEFAVVGD